ncbi:hypothetical protein EVAR_66406_1 [Eumeta japonica]|uniref:Uncharacterized protein n=1 Tax=Eumeta variegata TaxID=151549 RepID=A0A4C2A2S0_EUMVA|nr:hypothetical protein EVAR_66406_1 [Eumeta japonica]
MKMQPRLELAIFCTESIRDSRCSMATVKAPEKYLGESAHRNAKSALEPVPPIGEPVPEIVRKRPPQINEPAISAYGPIT